MSKPQQKPVSPYRQACQEAVKTRAYLNGYEKMFLRYQEGWFNLGDKIGTPSIDDRNPYDAATEEYQGFEDAKKRLFHL